MRLWVALSGLLLAAALVRPSIGSAQTAADSAQAILEAARMLERDGRTDLARDLLEHLRRRWPESPAAQAALEQMRGLPREELSAFSRTSFVAYHTLYGAFLGVAIPAAFGADDPEPFGAGLLIGAPLGFIGSRLYERKHRLTDGQAGLIEFGSFWGAWQGLGLQLALDISEETTCDFDVCFTETAGTAVWTSAVIGSVVGLGTGLYVARNPVAGGTSSLIFHSSLWGTWYGVATGILLDAEDDNLLGAALIGGNTGLVLAAIAAPQWRPTSSRVRIISAAGLAGGLAGLGTVLLFNIEDDKGIIATTAAGSTLGLVLATALGRDQGQQLGQESLPLAPALLSGEGRLRWGIPVPTPVTLELNNGDRATAWRVGLLQARF